MKHLIKLVLLSLTFTTTPLLATGSHDHSHVGENAKFAVGAPAKGKPDRVYQVSMRDTMRFVFSPEFERLHESDVIRFEVRNDGKIRHEFSIGNAEEQKKHAEMMRKMPDMQHEDPNTVSLEPGETATITWRFKGGDTVVFACNIPGHYEAGMSHELAMIEPDQKVN
jgi:uncharacterized cupredoxin-like copper-binding protein